MTLKYILLNLKIKKNTLLGVLVLVILIGSIIINPYNVFYKTALEATGSLRVISNIDTQWTIMPGNYQDDGTKKTYNDIPYGTYTIAPKAKSKLIFTVYECGQSNPNCTNKSVKTTIDAGSRNRLFRIVYTTPPCNQYGSFKVTVTETGDKNKCADMPPLSKTGSRYFTYTIFAENYSSLNTYVVSREIYSCQFIKCGPCSDIRDPNNTGWEKVSGEEVYPPCTSGYLVYRYDTLSHECDHIQYDAAYNKLGAPNENKTVFIGEGVNYDDICPVQSPTPTPPGTPTPTFTPTSTPTPTETPTPTFTVTPTTTFTPTPTYTTTPTPTYTPTPTTPSTPTPTFTPTPTLTYTPTPTPSPSPTILPKTGLNPNDNHMPWKTIAIIDLIFILFVILLIRLAKIFYSKY